MPIFAIDNELIMEELLMSTTTDRNEEEMKLDTQSADSYSPETETYIWYN